MELLVRTLEGHKDCVGSVAVSPDGKYIISGSYDKTVKVWEFETGKLVRTLEGHKDPVSSVAISSDGEYIISGSRDETVKVWWSEYKIKRDLQKRKEKERLEKIKEMMEVSTRINLDMMRDVLDMDKKTFNNKIFEWAKEFSFIIDGDYLNINKETISDFIYALDKQFAIWEKGKEKI